MEEAFRKYHLLRARKLFSRILNVMLRESVASEINIYFAYRLGVGNSKLISMLITFKVIILYIIQVIISMQTSVKMGNNSKGMRFRESRITSRECSYMQKTKLKNSPLVRREVVGRVKQGESAINDTQSRLPKHDYHSVKIFLFTVKSSGE